MQLKHLALVLLIIAIWGFNFVVIKVGLDEISPLMLCFARFFLTSIPAIFFVKKPDAPFRYVLGYGMFMFALQFSLLFMGISFGVSVGLTPLLQQLQVFFTIFMAIVLFKEKLKIWQIIGALVSFTGIAVVGMNLAGGIALSGFLLVIGAGLSFGAGNIFSKLCDKANMFSLVVWGSFIAWPPVLALSLIIDGPEKILHTIKHISWLSAGATLYITYLSTLVGFGVWNRLLQSYPLGTITPFTLMVPIIGILSSALCLNEALQPWKLFAAALVILGLCINILGPRFFPLKAQKV